MKQSGRNPSWYWPLTINRIFKFSKSLKFIFQIIFNVKDKDSLLQITVNLLIISQRKLEVDNEWGRFLAFDIIGIS